MTDFKYQVWLFFNLYFYCSSMEKDGEVRLPSKEVLGILVDVIKNRGNADVILVLEEINQRVGLSNPQDCLKRINLLINWLEVSSICTNSEKRDEVVAQFTEIRKLLKSFFEFLSLTETEESPLLESQLLSIDEDKIKLKQEIQGKVQEKILILLAAIYDLDQNITLTIREIAELLQISFSSPYRCLSNLHEGGYVSVKKEKYETKKPTQKWGLSSRGRKFVEDKGLLPKEAETEK